MDPVVIVELVAVAVLLALGLYLVAPPERRRSPGSGGQVQPDEDIDLTAGTELAHAEVLVAWAEGTRGDWDRHVRPVLARELDHRIGGRRSGSADRSVTGRMLFGSLWPLVDPSGRFTSKTGAPGPGRSALEAILERLEAA